MSPHFEGLGTRDYAIALACFETDRGLLQSLSQVTCDNLKLDLLFRPIQFGMSLLKETFPNKDSQSP
jgi:hypothetical protein